jgi:hypothetical protein
MDSREVEYGTMAGASSSLGNFILLTLLRKLGSVISILILITLMFSLRISLGVFLNQNVIIAK